ncbi:hypothetical protein [Actinokineospora fastidiosa]|uniref:Uncharacterized protein n=1 Tax=Actinokineospora fastidiosa TaxID=1816 RepID=A0A918LJV6_9PSEU|nr:hypothetical protein [Actinokineospora fastidiosa]GGS59590.1 hypothetical protein GCM10010171_63190 [Actinokineospora fastidiosa]
MALAPVITALAAVVLVGCLLYRAFRQRRSEAASGRHSLAASYIGRHWRQPKQPPSPMLLHALETVGTHGFGFTRESEAA